MVAARRASLRVGQTKHVNDEPDLMRRARALMESLEKFKDDDESVRLAICMSALLNVHAACEEERSRV